MTENSRVKLKIIFCRNGLPCTDRSHSVSPQDRQGLELPPITSRPEPAKLFDSTSRPPPPPTHTHTLIHFTPRLNPKHPNDSNQTENLINTILRSVHTCPYTWTDTFDVISIPTVADVHFLPVTTLSIPSYKQIHDFRCQFSGCQATYSLDIQKSKLSVRVFLLASGS